jgi:CheY-like chemotaxis protein
MMVAGVLFLTDSSQDLDKILPNCCHRSKTGDQGRVIMEIHISTNKLYAETVNVGSSMLNNEEFQKLLRSALKHLYNPDFLRQSRLSSVFGVGDRFDSPMALQRILTDAIQAMRPGNDVLEAAQVWHTYDILLYRYIQQLTQDQVAGQLGISSRQLAREQETALEVLAVRLWDQYQIGETYTELEVTQALSPEDLASNLTNNLRWLEETPYKKGTNLIDEMNDVVNLVNSLAENHSVTLELKMDTGIPDILVHPVAIRQILVSVLNVAIDQAGQGSVQIQVTHLEGDVEVRITGSSFASASELGENDQSSLAMAHELVSMSKGRMAYSFSSVSFHIQLVFPTFKPVIVLVIDDNQDFLDLFRRYTHGTRFHLIVTRNPHRAINLVEEHSPKVIVLDVMMPEMDGWQMLGRLRRHPSSSHLPILICSIVQQEELARTLGAKGFLRKPVTRKNLLDALDQLAENEERGPR